MADSVVDHKARERLGRLEERLEAAEDRMTASIDHIKETLAEHARTESEQRQSMDAKLTVLHTELIARKAVASMYGKWQLIITSFGMLGLGILTLVLKYA